MVKTINITETWVQACKVHIVILEHGDEFGKKLARLEIMRLAEAMDRANGRTKKKPSSKTKKKTKPKQAEASKLALKRLNILGAEIQKANKDWDRVKVMEEAGRQYKIKYK